MDHKTEKTGIKSSFIKCPRCKYNVKSHHNNNRYKFKGVCSHCMNEYFYRKRSYLRIDKRKTEYIKVRSSNKCNKESVKVVLSKLVELLENNMILLKAFNLSKHVPYKLTLASTDKYCLKATKTFHEPKIHTMFKAPLEKLKESNEQSVQAEKLKQGIRYIYVEPQQTNIQYEHVPSMPVPKQCIESGDEIFMPIQSHKKIVKTDHRHEHSELTWETHDKKTIDCSCMDNLKTCWSESIHTIAQDLSSKNFKNTNSSTVQRIDSSEFLNKSISELTEKTFDYNFSYFFPKEDCVQSAMQTYKSSSEIIKEVMEMLSARTEERKYKKDLKSEKDIGDRFKKHVNKTKDKIKTQPKITKTPDNSTAKSKSTKSKEVKSKSSKVVQKQGNVKKEKLDPVKETTKREVPSAEKKIKTLDKPPTDNLKPNVDREKKFQETKKPDQKDRALPLPFPLKNLDESKKNLSSKKQDEKRKSQDITKMKLINISNIQIRIPDNILLQLMKKKQAERGHFKPRPKSLSEIKVSPRIIKRHQRHKFARSLHVLHCMVCENSDLDLDVDNILYNTNKTTKMNKMIIGTKVFKNVRPVKIPLPANEFQSMLFKTTFNSLRLDNSKNDEVKRSAILEKKIEQEDKGVVRYALSDRSFIDKGWTKLPTEKIVRRLNIYRMKPAQPEFDWFKYNKNKKRMLYDTGEKLAEFDDDGKGCWYYKNGRKALDYYETEEINAQQRYVVYSNGKPDNLGRSRPLTILATFDYLGNGIIFEHSGKIRLKYNQTEGVLLDRSLGPASHWKWHSLNDPPVLQPIMIDTHIPHKDPDILKFSDDTKPKQVNEEMIEIELDNLMREKRKKMSQKFEPFQIRMKAMKINENFSLKVLGQSTVYLIFRDGTTNIKLNIGMILDNKEIIDTDTAEVGVVANTLERYPANSTSLERLQKSVAYAQRVERARVERDRRIRPTQSCASADKLTAGASKPLRQPFRTAPSDTSSAECHCGYKKSFTKNVYYDTRLI